ncbi:MAG: glutaredoxin [Thermoleophilaceae bacterium]|nr:glutaredoxin [Thermoleophilaceae bacterium]
MADVTLYTSKTCPFCLRAEALMKRKGVGYERIVIHRFMPGGRDVLRERFGHQHWRIPQIVIGGEHVGGCSELLALEREGRLDPLLGA